MDNAEKRLEEMLADEFWRLNHLYWIETKTGELVRFRMNWAQLAFWKEFWYRDDILKSRQLGLSTYVAMLMLDYCLFRPRFKAGIIDKALPDAQEKLRKIRLAYEMLDYVPEDGATEEDEALAAIGAAIKRRCRARFKEESAVFGNGSRIRVALSMRGGTLQMLHVSELAHVANTRPKDASEIVTGAINTVASGCIVIRETTHEGGRYGLNYELTKRSIENIGNELTPLDFKFFFFPWHQHPDYRIEGVKLRLDDRMTKYFALLETQDIHLTDEQKAWYVSMERTMGAKMTQEYPSTPDEAFDVQVEGAIYGSIITRMRMDRKLNCRFEVDRMAPLNVAFDIGMADSTVVWLFNELRTEHRVVEHYRASGEVVAHFVEKLRQWETEYGKIDTVFLPHDAVNRERSDGLSYEDRIRSAGFRVVVVPRVQDVWQGVDLVREFLPNCIFHERCGDVIVVKDVEYISGIDALSNYQVQPPGRNGVMRPKPLHDVCSDSADAFRIYVEAHARGLVPIYGNTHNPYKFKRKQALGVPKR